MDWTVCFLLFSASTLICAVESQDIIEIPTAATPEPTQSPVHNHTIVDNCYLRRPFVKIYHNEDPDCEPVHTKLAFCEGSTTSYDLIHFHHTNTYRFTWKKKCAAVLKKIKPRRLQFRCKNGVIKKLRVYLPIIKKCTVVSEQSNILIHGTRETLPQTTTPDC